MADQGGRWDNERTRNFLSVGSIVFGSSAGYRLIVEGGQGGRITVLAVFAVFIGWANWRFAVKRRVTWAMVVATCALSGPVFLLFVIATTEGGVVGGLTWLLLVAAAGSCTGWLIWRLRRNRELSGSALRFLPPPPNS